MWEDKQILFFLGAFLYIASLCLIFYLWVQVILCDKESTPDCVTQFVKTECFDDQYLGNTRKEVYCFQNKYLWQCLWFWNPEWWFDIFSCSSGNLFTQKIRILDEENDGVASESGSTSSAGMKGFFSSVNSPVKWSTFKEIIYFWNMVYF